MAIVALTTERLTLRPPTRADADRIALLVGDLGVSRWLTHVPHPYHHEDALAWIDGIIARADQALLICKNGIVAGTIGLSKELGYWLGRDYWGHGYAAEAARALLSRHFQTSNDAIASGYHIGNARSAAVLCKLGFTPAHREEARVAATSEIVQVQKMRLNANVWRGLA